MSGSGSYKKPQDDDYEQVKGLVKIGAAAAAGIGLAGYLIGSFFSSGEDEQSKKTMKAPGQNTRIIREEFEENPRKYFRDLRKKP